MHDQTHLIHHNQTFARKREDISLTDTIKGVKDVKAGRVNLHSALNCLISLGACKMEEKGRKTTDRFNELKMLFFCMCIYLVKRMIGLIV